MPRQRAYYFFNQEMNACISQKSVNNVCNDPFGMICHLTLEEALSNLFSDLGAGHVGLLPLVLHPPRKPPSLHAVSLCSLPRGFCGMPEIPEVQG